MPFEPFAVIVFEKVIPLLKVCIPVMVNAAEVLTTFAGNCAKGNVPVVIFVALV